MSCFICEFNKPPKIMVVILQCFWTAVFLDLKMIEEVLRIVFESAHNYIVRHTLPIVILALSFSFVIPAEAGIHFLFVFLFKGLRDPCTAVTLYKPEVTLSVPPVVGLIHWLN